MSANALVPQKPRSHVWGASFLVLLAVIGACVLLPAVFHLVFGLAGAVLGLVMGVIGAVIGVIAAVVGSLIAAGAVLLAVALAAVPVILIIALLIGVGVLIGRSARHR